MRYIFAFILAAQSLHAETCPPSPDHAAALANLTTALNAAPNMQATRAATQEIWRLWTDAPDEIAQALLDRGMQQRESYDFLSARDTLDALVDYCPNYAEGYNQRAFANFLRRDYSAALVDLNKTLEIMPTHFAALSGKALTLNALGREDEAQEALRAALALNPWLAERRLLKEPPGEEI